MQRDEEHDFKLKQDITNSRQKTNTGENKGNLTQAQTQGRHSKEITD